LNDFNRIAMKFHLTSLFHFFQESGYDFSRGVEFIRNRLMIDVDGVFLQGLLVFF
jgi:hypothetical protein